jgi:low affinity Fe/Cu permease
VKQFFSQFSNFISKWTGSHWAFFVAGALVAFALLSVGVELTNISISVITMLMLFILQNTQNRDSAAVQVKLDELITHVRGPRDEIAGIESKGEDEIEELRKEDP